jgi:hypothetical protein
MVTLGSTIRACSDGFLDVPPTNATRANVRAEVNKVRSSSERIVAQVVPVTPRSEVRPR